MINTLSESASILFYITVIVLGIGLIRVADKKNSRFILAIVILLFSVVIGFRYYVGQDFGGYVNAYNIISTKANILDARKWYIIETSFYYLAFISKTLTGGFQFIFIFYGFLTTLFFMLGIWYFRNQIRIEWAMLYYCTTFFFGSFNTIRQYLAMAIICFAFRYAIERKPIKYFLMVALAMGVHSTAIIAIIIYFYGAERSAVGKIARIFNYVGPVILVFGVNYIVGFIQGLSYSRIAGYSVNTHFGYGIILQIIILYLFMHSSGYKSNSLEDNAHYFVKEILILSTTLCLLDYTLGDAARIRNYFSTIEMIAMASYPSTIFRNNSEGKFPTITKYDAFLFAYYILFLVLSFVNRDPYIYPYQFIM